MFLFCFGTTDSLVRLGLKYIDATILIIHSDKTMHHFSKGVVKAFPFGSCVRKLKVLLGLLIRIEDVVFSLFCFIN